MTKQKHVELNMLTDTYWQAIIERDSRFDFQFYYGVKATKSFCKPSCKSLTPLRKNVIYFDTIADAYIKISPCLS
jgi:methylphosphotriester-DNA--protein-cysteine methyltransferase